jgi:hypothetical protein
MRRCDQRRARSSRAMGTPNVANDKITSPDNRNINNEFPIWEKHPVNPNGATAHALSWVVGVPVPRGTKAPTRPTDASSGIIRRTFDWIWGYPAEASSCL